MRTETMTLNRAEERQIWVNNCMEDSVEWDLCQKLMEVVFKTDKHREAIIEILRKDTVGGIPNRWDIYNAVTSYATHNEQLKPNVEMLLQKQAQQILVTPSSSFILSEAVQ